MNNVPNVSFCNKLLVHFKNIFRRKNRKLIKNTARRVHYKDHMITLYNLDKQWKWNARHIETGLNYKSESTELRSQFESWKECKKILDSMKVDAFRVTLKINENDINGISYKVTFENGFYSTDIKQEALDYIKFILNKTIEKNKAIDIDINDKRKG